MTNSVTVADLQPGVLFSGVRPGLVTVVAAAPLGESVNLVFRDGAGEYGDRLLYPADLAVLAIQAPQSRWSFDADGAEFRLAAEAQRIGMAGIHDPMLARTVNENAETLRFEQHDSKSCSVIALGGRRTNDRTAVGSGAGGLAPGAPTDIY